jgi:hypothetical protein
MEGDEVALLRGWILLCLIIEPRDASNANIIEYFYVNRSLNRCQQPETLSSPAAFLAFIWLRVSSIMQITLTRLPPMLGKLFFAIRRLPRSQQLMSIPHVVAQST